MQNDKKTAFKAAVKGISAYSVAKALSKQIDSDWRGCSKDFMAACFANTRDFPQMARVDLVKLSAAAKAI